MPAEERSERLTSDETERPEAAGLGEADRPKATGLGEAERAAAGRGAGAVRDAGSAVVEPVSGERPEEAAGPAEAGKAERADVGRGPGAVRGAGSDADVPGTGVEPVSGGVAVRSGGSDGGAGSAATESAAVGSSADGDAEPEAASTWAVPSRDTDPAPDAPHRADDDGEPTATDAVSAPDAEGTPRRTTRRFPLFTRDTARPEGGGRAASREAPAPARQWPILVVLGAVGLGLLLTAFDVFRFGLLLIGAAMLGGAVLRWALPDVGMLAVRSRFTDLLTYGVLGTAIVLLALMAQPNPVLEIPFLESTLHYTDR